MGKKRKKKTAETSDGQNGFRALFRYIRGGSPTEIERYVNTSSSPFTEDERSILVDLYLGSSLYTEIQMAKKLGVPLARFQEIKASAIKKLQDRFGAA